MTTPEDRIATQEFTARFVLLDYTGMRLTPDLLDKIVVRLVHEMTKGPTAWAFAEQEKK